VATLQEYYKILGVNTNATINDIKQSYRKKAMQLHPDRNANPDAHEQFILLNEAYEYLIKQKEGKVTAGNRQAYYENWQDQQREEARQRAREYARMQYDEFIKSDRYKTIRSMEVILQHAQLLFAFSLWFIVPPIAYIYADIQGLIGAIVIGFLTIQFTVPMVRENWPPNFKLIGGAIKIIAQNNAFKIALLTAFNVLVILRVGLQTLIPLWALALAFIMPMVGMYALLRFKYLPYNTFRQAFYAFCYVPLFLNFLFLVNFVFSHNNTMEKHGFYCDTQSGTRSSPRQNTTYIFLKDGMYDEYPGIRYFMDYNMMDGKNKITYTMADGLFGLRVMKDYEFSN
jgi:hypothetical protein